MNRIGLIFIIVIFTMGNIFFSNAKTYRATQIDSQGRVVTVTLSIGNSQKVLEPVKQYRIKYNLNGDVSEKAIYVWSSGDGNWSESKVYKYGYDSRNQLFELSFADWDNKKSEWNNYQYTFFANLNNREFLSINYLDSVK